MDKHNNSNASNFTPAVNVYILCTIEKVGIFSFASIIHIPHELLELLLMSTHNKMNVKNAFAQYDFFELELLSSVGLLYLPIFYC